MTVDIPLYNLGIIVGITAILIYQLNRFDKSEKPIFIEPRNLGKAVAIRHNSFGKIEHLGGGQEYTDEEFKKIKKEAKTKYNLFL